MKKLTPERLAELRISALTRNVLEATTPELEELFRGYRAGIEAEEARAENPVCAACGEPAPHYVSSGFTAIPKGIPLCTKHKLKTDAGEVARIIRERVGVRCESIAPNGMGIFCEKEKGHELAHESKVHRMIWPNEDSSKQWPPSDPISAYPAAGDAVRFAAGWQKRELKPRPEKQLSDAELAHEAEFCGCKRARRACEELKQYREWKP